jgi:hypothetical protein
MFVPYKVLLPKRIFRKAKSEQEVQALTKEYMMRYPHYSLICIEDGFALCERINNSTQEGKNG